MRGKHDLVTVLQYYGSTARDGSSWMSVKCILHNDTHASASISPDREMYFCFVCDFEGDVYKVIMNKEGTTKENAINRAETITNGYRREVSSQYKSRDSLLPPIKGDRKKRGRYVPTRNSF